MPTVTPMIHVPDVRATAAWYEHIGFTVRAVNEANMAIYPVDARGLIGFSSFDGTGTGHGAGRSGGHRTSFAAADP